MMLSKEQIQMLQKLIPPRKTRRKLFLYLGCLFMAAFFWLIVSMAKVYTFTQPVHISYTNVPDNFSFDMDTKREISIKLKGSGWRLLFFKLSQNISELNVDMSTMKGQKFILLNSNKEYFKEQISPKINIVEISPDTLYFDFSVRSQKKVPIKLDAGIFFKSQFYYAKELKLYPDSVSISGPNNIIDTIKEWPTTRVVLNGLNKSVSMTIPLVNNNLLRISPLESRLDIPVEEFTEASVSLPVNILNNESNYAVSLHPTRVKVIYIVPLSKYKMVNPGSFIATADLNEWLDKKQSRLGVHIADQPDYVRVSRIEPSRIDFLIKK